MKLHAQWICGFVDGEGCFHIAVNKNNKLKNAFQILPEFVVTQHKRDVQVLHALKAYWGCGVVRKNHRDRLCYRVRSQKDFFEKIIPFFEKHTLKTAKHVDFLQFRDILLMMAKKEHLTKEGAKKIAQKAQSMRKWNIQDKVQLISESESEFVEKHEII